MDHSTANLMGANHKSMVTKKIESGFTRLEKERTLTKGEYMMHNTEQHKQHAYYKKIGDKIKQYGAVILFGATHAKEELANLLKEDRGFEKIKIDVKHADKMTENNQHAFVKEYFKKML